MTLYLYYKLKGLLTDRSILFWGLVFTLFWVLMWIYAFTRIEGPLPPPEVFEEILRVNTALALSYLGALAMGSVAIGLAATAFASSSAVAFATRFTKLTPTKYLVEDFMAGVVAVVAYALACVAMVVAATYARFGVIVLPESPALVVAYLALCGILLYWLSRAVALAMLALGKPRLPLLQMLPLFLALLNYATLWLDLGDKVYALPLAPLLSLIVSAASGVEPATGGWLAEGWLWRSLARGVAPEPPNALSAPLALASTAAWALALAAVSLTLTRKVKGVALEEFAPS